MTEQTVTPNVQHYTISGEIFAHPDLDIYGQMAYIVLSTFLSESAKPSLPELCKKGRMSTKQAAAALLSLVDHQLIPNKLFRQLVGEFQDDRLSWSAKGLLTYCKAHPAVGLDELLAMSDRSGEDEENIRKALQELKAAGYLEEFPEWSRLAV